MSTPQVKFESPVDSLADSFVSTPGTAYPSLFHPPDTMDPSEVMTPQSYEDESMFGGSMNGSMAGTPAPEKKQVKKRKSWGQQLPEPKTNLPPRKRAKTEDEKEQRRVERVLRNRRAAQSSRERKRQEVEALELQKQVVEQTNADLLKRLQESEARNAALERQLQQMSGGMKAFHSSSSVASSPGAAEPLRHTPRPSITFSQNLFGPSDADQVPISAQPVVDAAIVRTVNPASLSPEMSPVDATSNAHSSDVTQHPAAVLCDLPCPSEGPRPWSSRSTASISRIWTVLAMIQLGTRTISTFLHPLSRILTSLKTGSSLPPTSSIISLIMWITTTTSSLTSTSSMSSSTTTTRLRPRFSLRIRLLRRLLACNPHLARPLQDATVAMLRSASEQQLPDCLSAADARRRAPRSSPGVATLMTLLWVIHLIEKERTLPTPKLDAAAVVGQLEGEDRRRRGGEAKRLPYVLRPDGVDRTHPASVDHGRQASKQERP